MNDKQITNPEAAADPQGRLDALVSAIGGPEELLNLLADYRQITGQLARACNPGTPPRPAHSVVVDARTWWSRRQLMRMALDLPEREGRLFLGR
jgi:hypothetical protein